MTDFASRLKNRSILVADDEKDVLETIEDLLEHPVLDFAEDYKTASEKIAHHKYDLAILDITGVNGMKLLEECVQKEIPAIILTANAVTPEALMESIEKGAISYIPKESLADLESLVGELLSAHEQGKPPWKFLFHRLGSYFDKQFGSNWKEKDKTFWNEFTRTYYISKGIQERLKARRDIADKGI
ncbi:MAG: response regulator [Desulfobacteraceae bacterium]